MWPYVVTSSDKQVLHDLDILIGLEISATFRFEDEI